MPYKYPDFYSCCFTSLFTINNFLGSKSSLFCVCAIVKWKLFFFIFLVEVWCCGIYSKQIVMASLRALHIQPFSYFSPLMWNQFSILRNNAHTWILIMYSVIKMSVSDACALELSYQKWYSEVFAEKLPSLIKLRKAVFVLDLLGVDACLGNRSTSHFVFQPGFAANWCTMQAWKKLTLQLSWTLYIWLLRSLERSKVSHLSMLRDWCSSQIRLLILQKFLMWTDTVFVLLVQNRCKSELLKSLASNK